MSGPDKLGGLPSDYEVLGGAIPRNRSTGEMGLANNPNGYFFTGQTYKIVGGKLVPTFAMPGAATPALSAQDQADLALGRAVRALVKP